MNDIEKRILVQYGSGNRLDCLSRLAEYLQIVEDKELQNHILNVITKVCSFETDTMFQAYIQKIRKEAAGNDEADEV